MQHASAAIAAVAVGAAVFVAAAADLSPRPAMELQDVVLRCHAPWARKDRHEGTMDIVMRVGRDGRVKEYLMPAGTLPWMTEAAKCVADRLEFYPASLRTTTVESWAILPLEFNLTRNPHYDAEVSPPTLRSGEQAIMEAYRRCYPPGRTDTEGGRVR